jgi:acetyl esterase/lipase
MKYFTWNSIGLFACLLFAQLISAQQKENYTEIALWEKGFPNSNGTEGQEPNDDKGIFKPMIRVYLPPKESSTGRAIIVLPGGGYSHLAYNHEGYDFAPFFTAQGIACIVLKYRMPKGNRVVPFSDAEEAIRLVKQHAQEWNIKPADIGIMGSSAGGHLASTIATHSKPEFRPAFQVLLYPVITMDSTYGHKGSRRNLLGNTPSDSLVNAYSNEKQVTKETPRAFIVFSGDDKTVPVANGVNYYSALNKLGIPAALYIYPTGGHGWGIRDSFKYKLEFLMELKTWLKSF